MHSRADNVFLPSRVPIHSNKGRPKKHKLLAQISYPNQFATVIVTIAGALITAPKAREVEKVSQDIIVKLVLTNPQLTNAHYNGQN
jgi:hypothetical protein